MVKSDNTIFGTINIRQADGLLMLGMVFCGSVKNTVTIERNVHDLAEVASAEISAVSKKKFIIK
ncbi:MAG: hypothetical protein VR65_28060 [Desulfobulbaceae bacterium BRH_c16a]|nr:MAG: hypothetical protein VR65_28060 [Desulfobulbaceae bacterium BRH_c16a]